MLVMPQEETLGFMFPLRKYMPNLVQLGLITGAQNCPSKEKNAFGTNHDHSYDHSYDGGDTNRDVDTRRLHCT